jgi:ankyrin repeat protein
MGCCASTVNKPRKPT